MKGPDNFSGPKEFPLGPFANKFYENFIEIGGEISEEIKKKKTGWNTDEEDQKRTLEYEEIYENLSPLVFKGMGENHDGEVSVKEMIDRDIEKVKCLREKNDSDKTQEGILLERIMVGPIYKENKELRGFLEVVHDKNKGGDYVNVEQTTEYDDRINHTDSVLELGSGDEEIKIALDFTTSKDNLRIRGKIETIVKEIQKAKLTNIKYFKDYDGQEGPLKMIPRVVIIVESEKIEEICKEYLEGGVGPNSNYIQLYVYMQIEEQLKIQSQYIDTLLVESEKKEDYFHLNNLKEAKKVLEGTLGFVSRFIEMKKNSIDDRCKDRAIREKEKSEIFKNFPKNYLMNY